jgi:hypothetical protein
VAIVDSKLNKENYLKLELNGKVQYTGYFYKIKPEDNIILNRKD